MFKDIAQLIVYDTTQDETHENYYDVYVNKKSVSRQEFYASYQVGVNLSCIFELRTEDYEMTKLIEDGTNRPMYATKIKFENCVYDIVRSYDKPNGMTELTCI